MQKKRFIGFHVKKCWLLCGLVLERVESERKWHSRKLVPDSVQSHLYSSSETLCSHYPSIPPSPTTLTNNLSPEDHGAFWTLIFGHAIMLFLTTRKAFCTLELIPTWPIIWGPNSPSIQGSVPVCGPLRSYHACLAHSAHQTRLVAQDLQHQSWPVPKTSAPMTGLDVKLLWEPKCFFSTYSIADRW